MKKKAIKKQAPSKQAGVPSVDPASGVADGLQVILNTTIERARSHAATYERMFERCAHANWRLNALRHLLRSPVRGPHVDRATDHNIKCFHEEIQEALRIERNADGRCLISLEPMGLKGWKFLRTQKRILANIVLTNRLPTERRLKQLEGLLNLLDHIQDEAAKIIGEDTVFGGRRERKKKSC